MGTPQEAERRKAPPPPWKDSDGRRETAKAMVVAMPAAGRGPAVNRRQCCVAVWEVDINHRRQADDDPASVETTSRPVP